MCKKDKLNSYSVVLFSFIAPENIDVLGFVL